MLKKELVTEARRLGMRPSVAAKARKADLEKFIKENSVAAKRAARRRAKQPHNRRNLPPVPKAMHASGIEAIREVAANKTHKDSFAVGDVIRWKSDAGYNVFLYAALKTPVGWVTTSRSGNRFVPQTLDFDELLEVMGRSETLEIAVATDWEQITE